MLNFPFRVFCRSLIFIWSEYFYLLFDVAEGTLVKESTCGTQAPEGWHPTMVSTHQRVTSGWWSVSNHGEHPPAGHQRLMVGIRPWRVSTSGWWSASNHGEYPTAGRRSPDLRPAWDPLCKNTVWPLVSPAGGPKNLLLAARKRVERCLSTGNMLQPKYFSLLSPKSPK